MTFLCGTGNKSLPSDSVGKVVEQSIISGVMSAADGQL